MDTTLVFDIETIPDTQSGQLLLDLPPNLPQNEILEAMKAKRRAESGDDFLRHHLQKIVCISCVLANPKEIRVWSLGNLQDTEPQIIQRFFQGLRKFQPTLISWNGTGFDLPVLHYRTLIHGIEAPEYWETGDTNSAFKWNNYLNRYHYRHLDLMDVLSGYQAKSAAKLDDIAILCGLPGKMGLSGDQVLTAYQEGNLESIRHYCEIDVLNTYLLYLRFEKMRGKIAGSQYQTECERLYHYLKLEQKPHFEGFLEKWGFI